MFMRLRVLFAWSRTYASVFLICSIRVPAAQLEVAKFVTAMLHTTVPSHWVVSNFTSHIFILVWCTIIFPSFGQVILCSATTCIWIRVDFCGAASFSMDVDVQLFRFFRYQLIAWQQTWITGHSKNHIAIILVTSSSPGHQHKLVSIQRTV